MNFVIRLVETTVVRDYEEKNGVFEVGSSLKQIRCNCIFCTEVLFSFPNFVTTTVNIALLRLTYKTHCISHTLTTESILSSM